MTQDELRRIIHQSHVWPSGVLRYCKQCDRAAARVLTAMKAKVG